MKYIDVDKLKAEIDKRYREYRTKSKGDKYYEGMADSLDYFEQFIDSLQQDFPTTDEQVKEFLATHPKIKMPEKYKNPDWLFKNQEQPKVDLEKEIDKYCELIQAWQIQEAPYTSIENCARHFYELGRKGGSK